LEFLSRYLEKVEQALQELKLPESPATLYEPQTYMLGNGGKRLRPILTLMGCGLCGTDRLKAMPAALAVELVHNFTLIHDDIMDQAGHRRGQPSVHKKWNSSVAILSGDSMYTRAMMLLDDLGEDVDYRRVINLFLQGINKICEGQALDMEFEQRETVLPDEYMEMIAGKTGALLESSLQMGGIIGGCSDEKLIHLQQVGSDLGYAFQIQDDLLDVIADPEKFGKRVAGDIFEGKKTYLMILALERCNKEQQKWLMDCLKSKPLRQHDVEMIINLYREHGVIESAREKIRQLYIDAENSLEIFGESEDKRDLIHLIKTLKKRDH
jgi:geranylgeranyl diphosphate synthase, type II